MDKPKRRRADNGTITPSGVPDTLSAIMTDRDIARRAYELYQQRDSDAGHDLMDDWLQAERELRSSVSVTIHVTDIVLKA